jgi:hypothetical protein
MKFKWFIFFIISGILFSQNIICQENNDQDFDNNSEKDNSINNNWIIYYLFGPSISFGFFDYISFQYGLGSRVSFREILPLDSTKSEKNIAINNYLMYEYKEGYSKIRVTTNFSMFPNIFLGCSLLIDVFEKSIIWGYSPEIGLRSPHGFLDIYYRYNIYEHSNLNRHEFGLRLSLFLFALTNDK